MLLSLIVYDHGVVSGLYTFKLLTISLSPKKNSAIIYLPIFIEVNCGAEFIGSITVGGNP